MTKKWNEDEEDDGNDDDVEAQPELGEVLDTFAAHDYDFGMQFLNSLTTTLIRLQNANQN